MLMFFTYAVLFTICLFFSLLSYWGTFSIGALMVRHNLTWRDILKSKQFWMSVGICAVASTLMLVTGMVYPIPVV